MANNCPPGKVWAGSDYGCQSPQTIWKKQKPGSKVGETKSLPGLGTKVWTGPDYGWQTQSTIDARKKGATPKPSSTPKPKASPTPAPAAEPESSSTTPKPSSTTTPKAKASPTTSKPSSTSKLSPTAQKIKSGLETYRKQVASGDVKGAEKTGKSTWALANPKLAAVAAERERTRGTSATTNPLMKDFKSRLPSPKSSYSSDSSASKPKPKTDTATQRVQSVSEPAAKSIDSEVKKRKIPTFNTSKMTKTNLNQSYEYDAYDLVLEYLLDTGHVDSIEEANYVMMQMNSEMIQNIVESGLSFPIEHEKAGTEKSNKIRKAADAAVPNAERKYKSSGGGPVMFPVKGA